MVNQEMIDEILEDGEVTNFDMFEILTCTSWGDMRFKPPPNLKTSLGWRTEFRTPDSVLTEKQSIMLTYAITVLTRMI